MSLLPLKTAISDTYPLPSNATARAGFASLWDSINEFQQKSEIDLASAATCDIGGQLSTKLRITGATGVTSFGTNYRGPILLRFSGAVTLTNNATTLRLPGSTNLTTAAGDVLMAWPTATVSGALDGWQVVLLGYGGGAAAEFSAIKQTANTSATGVVELATDAEALAGTDATRAVTSAGLASMKLNATNGYHKYPGGRIEQWGTVVTNGSGIGNVIFPIAFPATLYAIVVSTNSTSSILSTFQAESVTGFSAQTWTTTTGANAASIKVHWRATGV